MFKNKRGSTLVLALLLFAFVMIIGTGTVMLTSVSTDQTTVNLGDQQAEFTARSVLDAVISKVRAGAIDPTDTKTTGVPIAGNGEDDTLGSYDFTIKQFTQGGTPDLYKITVNANYKGHAATISSVIQRFSEEEEQPEIESPFDVLGLATGNSVTDNYINNSHLYGSMRVDNNGDKLVVGSGGFITGSLDVIGSLEISGGAYVGTAGEDNAIKATGDVVMTGSGSTVSGDLWSLGNVSVSGGAEVDGDIHADGNVTISNGDVVNGNIEAKGNVVVDGYVNGNITTNGSVDIKRSVRGNITAMGDIIITNCDSTGDTVNITTNGSVYVVGGNIKANVTAGGNIAIGEYENGSGYGGTVTGNLTAYHVNKNTAWSVKVSHQSTVTGQIASVADVLINDWSTRYTGSITTNGSMTINNSTVSSNVTAQGNFDMNHDASGDVKVGGNASITNGRLTGSIWARGNGYFPNKNCVTGNIYLGGTYSGNSKNSYEIVDPASIQLPQPIVQALPLNSLPVEEVQVIIDTQAPEWVIPSDIMAEMAQVQVDFDLTKSSGANYTVDGSKYIINQNCTLKSITFDQGWKNKSIVFDATDQDLYIMLATPDNNGSTITFNTTDVLTKGDHNVFLLLDDGDGGNHVNLRVNSGHVFSYIDYQYSVPYNDPRVPRLFIISNSTAPGSFIDFTGGSSLYGFIYAPYYKATINEYPIFSYKLYGAVIASSINFNYPNYVQYSPDLHGSVGGPNYDDTGGGQTGQTVSWARLGTYFGSGEGG